MDTDLANTVIQVDMAVLAFLAGTVIPLLTAVVTRSQATSGLKAVVNLVLSMAAGGVAFLVANNGQGGVLELIASIVAVYLASGVSYQNLWKPTGVTNATSSATNRFGLGGGEPVQVAPDTDNV